MGSDAGRASGEYGELILAGLLAPDPGVDPAVAASAVDRDPHLIWLRPILALAHDRAGRDKEAIVTLLRVNLENPGWPGESTTWPMLAMACRRPGNAAEAAKWSARYRDLRRTKSPRFGPDPIEWAGPWPAEPDWVDFDLLAREAEASIDAPSPPAR